MTNIGKEKEKQQLNWKRRILLTRVTFGLIFNIVGFITVCVVNRNIYLDAKSAKGLFITIVVFTVMPYSITVVHVWFTKHNIKKTNLAMVFYRYFEILFDVLVLFYSLVLSELELTEFTKATSVLSCVDIFINIIMLGRNCYDIYKKDDITNYIYISIVL